MAFATPVLVTSAAAQGSGGTAAVTAARDTTSATLLVVILSNNNTAPAPSDNKVNVWAPVNAGHGITPAGRIWYAANPIVGPGHTFSSNSSSFPGIAMLAFRGIRATTPLDKQSGANLTNSANSISAGLVTPAEDNEVIVMGLMGYTAEPIAVNVGTLLHHLPILNGVAFGISAAYEIQTTATPRNPQFTYINQSGANMTAEVATFRAAQVADPPPLTPAALAQLYGGRAVEERQKKKVEPPIEVMVEAIVEEKGAEPVIKALPKRAQQVLLQNIPEPDFVPLNELIAKVYASSAAAKLRVTRLYRAVEKQRAERELADEEDEEDDEVVSMLM